MIQCRRINKKGFAMQKKFFSFLLTAALLAFPSFADDGAYVVIERTYYEQCKNTFDSQCDYLYGQVGALFRSWDSEFNLILNQNSGYIHTISLAIAQIDSARSDLDLTDPDQVEADTHLQSARNSLISLDDNISRNNTLISQWQNELVDAKTDLENHIIACSNSFPYVVATTNLNIYIIVTNCFEAATNNYCCCTNEFEHFLNYYADAESQILDQYRETVTNFLNQSILADQINKTYWYGSQSISYYQNINWGMWNANNAAGAPPLSANLLWANNVRQNPWVSYTYRISSQGTEPVTLQEFTVFTLEGIHDSVNELAIDLRKSWLVLQDAMTNTTFSLATVNNKTNEFTQFLSMPESYSEQAAKVARSRNWFQRIELWLSSIALNTAPVKVQDEDQDSKQDIKNVIETATNEISVAASGINDSFIHTLPDLTNTTVALRGAVTSVSRILNSFKSSGGNRSSSSAPTSFNLMKTEFINTTFTRLGIEETEDMPYYIGADQYTEGFEDVQTAATWIHHIFGFIWLCSGIALLVFYARWLSSWVVTIWYRLLGMLVKVSKFTWGGS